MSIRHFFHSVGMLAIDVLLVAAGLLVPMLAALVFLFGFPLLAYANSFFFVGIFDKYIPKKEERDDDEFHPLEDEPEEQNTEE